MANETKNNPNSTEEELEENEDVEDQNNKDDSGKPGDDKSGKDGKDDSKDSKKSDNKTFTQDQVNRMMTREKNQGRAAALKELGIDPKDTKAIAMVKTLIDSQKTDEQKAAEKETETKTRMNEAEHRAQVAEAKAEAMMLGVKSQYVEDVVTLALAKMTEDSDMKTIIGEFKTKYPIWFGESEDDKDKDKSNKGKTGQKGTGSSVKADKDKKGEEKGLGARLAAQRKTGSGRKSSYWGNNK